MLSGTKLGRYEIRSKIGEGGMGEVYLAHDEQLNRNVALKVLLPEFCCDLDRVQRFKLEAKAASALNHPNIITIHEIDEQDDKLFIATEYVDGKTLREKIERGELSMLDSIRIAEQIADALAVAHEARIVHRDIKPENIMIRRDGYAKILDFGLAKPTLHQTAGTEDATIQMIKTQPGMVMGSVRYMSPEQARGKETDERTDVWSIGVVLYEMLTGKNPFGGETVSDSLAALIHIEPQPIEEVPEELQWILRKALKKNADERYQSIKDFSLDLKDLRSQLEQNTLENRAIHLSNTVGLARQDTSENKTLIHQTISAETTTAEKRNWVKTQVNTVSGNVGWRIMSILVIAFAVTVAAGAWFYLPSWFSGAKPVFQSIQVSAKTDNGKAQLASVSPDGKFVSFVDTQGGRPKLVVRQLVTDTTIEIVPSSLKHFYQPKFSPDGEFVYYVQIENGVGTLYRVSTLGGASKKILYDIDSSVSFSPDGQKLSFIRHNPTDGGDTIFISDLEGGDLEAFIDTKAVGYDKFNDVIWSGDGQRLLLGGYENTSQTFPRTKIIAVPASGENKTPTEPQELSALNKEGWVKATNFQWLLNNEGIIFIGKRNNDDNMQIWHSSYPEGLIKQVTTDTSDYASLSVSADGNTIVTTKVDRISSLVAFNPATKEINQLLSESRTFLGYLGLSQMSDGKILYSRLTGKEINIFSVNPDGTDERQITSDGRYNFDPVATPDGKYIIFSSNRNDVFGIWRMESNGSNPVQLTSVKNGRDGNLQITADGKTVLFNRETSDGGRGTLMKVPISGGEASPLLPDSKASEVSPQVSPDGKSLAYISFEYDSKTSDFDVALEIASLKNDEISGEPEKIKFDLNNRYKWSPDGRQLTYIAKKEADNIWNFDPKSKEEKALTDFKSGELTNFIWSRDGRRIFIVRGIANSDLVLIKDMEGAS
ncbi:MAG: protein kinase [Pyrinomonadaceae bacterium]